MQDSPGNPGQDQKKGADENSGSSFDIASLSSSNSSPVTTASPPVPSQNPETPSAIPDKTADVPEGTGKSTQDPVGSPASTVSVNPATPPPSENIQPPQPPVNPPDEKQQTGPQNQTGVYPAQSETPLAGSIEQLVKKPSETENVQANESESRSSKSHLLKKLLLPLFIIVILSLIGFSIYYFFVITPKKNIQKGISLLNPHVSAYKSSVQDLISSADRLMMLTTEQAAPAEPLETSMGSVEVASRIMQNVENTLQAWGDVNIAGITKTAESISIKKTRAIKEESLKNVQFVDQAQAKLSLFVSESARVAQENPSIKTKLLSSSNIQENSQEFFGELKKISAYFDKLSEAVITAETKAESFIRSFASSTATFSRISSSDIAQIKLSLDQAKVFLEQAKNDSAEIETILSGFTGMPAEMIPEGMEEFHEHNLKIFNTLNDFFIAESKLLTGIFTATDNLMLKIDKGNAGSQDGQMFYLSVKEAVTSENRIEAKFISDTQTLAGEEQQLITSFWQNNLKIKEGKNILTQTDSYLTMLAKVKSENGTPF